ncbi:MAG: hypothetical protein H7Y17_17745 [Chlorobia bacterium]|nr:hypothetical protein [Fimbriimonadaceae bacterium]
MKMTNNIALGVGLGRLQEASSFYQSEMGMKLGETSKNWIELKAGDFNLYLVDDDHGTPTFEVLVPNVDEAMDRLIASGCEETILDGSPKERFVKTPFGQFFCVSPLAEN